MKKRKKGIYLIMSFIFSILLISMVSAGLWNKITGKAPTQPQDISITVVGTNPIVFEYIEAIPPQNPTESLTTTIEFDVWVTDPDGVFDIDDSSVFAEFTKLGEITRTGSCPWQNDIDSDTANYSCSVVMQYYDGAGTWNIKVNATDFGSATLVEDTSTGFIYQELKAMVISPASLTWPSTIPGSINQTSNNDPTRINNTGNYDGEVSVTSYDLLGEIIPTESIPSEDFSIGIISTGANEECNTPSTATSMGIDGTTTAITNSDSNPGPAPNNYEQIYYCIPSFPIVSSQTYSTTGGGSWYVLY